MRKPYRLKTITRIKSVILLLSSARSVTSVIANLIKPVNESSSEARNIDFNRIKNSVG